MVDNLSRNMGIYSLRCCKCRYKCKQTLCSHFELSASGSLQSRTQSHRSGYEIGFPMPVNEYKLEIQFKKVWKVQNIGRVPIIGI
jgi:hypothetical protein